MLPSAVDEIFPSDPSLQGPGREKECKSQRGWTKSRKEGLLNTVQPKHIWAQRDCGSVHRTCIALHQIGSQCWEVKGHKSPSLNQNLFPMDSHLQMKEYFSPVESHWVYNLLLRAGPTHSNRWSTQNELNDIFEGSWSQNFRTFYLFLNFTLQVICICFMLPVLCFCGIPVSPHLSVLFVCSFLMCVLFLCLFLFYLFVLAYYGCFLFYLILLLFFRCVFAF